MSISVRMALEAGNRTAVRGALLDMTKPDGDCRIWQGRVGKEGYPRLTLSGRMHGAHRLMAEAVHGPLHGQPVHHVCANPACIAPTHLQPVSQRENIAEMLERNWYIKRIAHLEAALRELAPDHELISHR